jgi:LmbE family N-acetylglucosaminyl deacetylase
MSATAELNGLELLQRLVTAVADEPAPSAMVVLAHPDDETVGAASLLPVLTLAAFVYLTDGAPRQLDDALHAGCANREEYATVRRGELLSALARAGVDAKRVEFVDCVDQELSRQLAALALWLEILLREHAPAIVLTHPYEGGHPDHDAAAFAVHAAARRIALSGGNPPILAEFTSYHARDGAWEFGTFLPSHQPVVTRELTPEQVALKRTLMDCYATQRGVLRHVPLVVERFRLAPDYDFTSPPHEGPLLFEQFPWGVTGAEWRARARQALRALELPERGEGR